jgi:DUF4097 and DUF4098 domain-containing protein YvlB
MASFETPEPISLNVELGVGHIRIAAADRMDTVVEVRPTDPRKRSDVSAAERILVEYAEGTLVVRAPRRWAYTVLGAGSESVDVEIAVPAGSRLTVEAAGGAPAVHATGRLGDCRVTTGAGPIHLGAAGSVQLRTGAGDVTVDLVAGPAEVSTGAGSVRIGAIEGPATIRGTTGEAWIGEAGGGVQVRASCGRISVDRAAQAVTAKTGYGDIRLGEVMRGTITAETGHGKVEVGVRQGVAAWLDLQTRFGDVLNELEAAGPPQSGEDTVEVRARSPFGDITVRRS